MLTPTDPIFIHSTAIDNRPFETTPDTATPPAEIDEIDNLTQAVASMRFSQSPGVDILVSPQEGAFEFKRFTKQSAKDPLLCNQAYRAALLGQKKLLESEKTVEEMIHNLFLQTKKTAFTIDKSSLVSSYENIQNHEKIITLIEVNLSLSQEISKKISSVKYEKNFNSLLLKITITVIRSLLNIYQAETPCKTYDQKYNELFKNVHQKVIALQKENPAIILPVITKYSIKDESIVQPLIELIPLQLHKGRKREDTYEDIDNFTSILEPHYAHYIAYTYLPEDRYFIKATSLIKTIPCDTNEIPQSIKERLSQYQYVNISHLYDAVIRFPENEKDAIYNHFTNLKHLAVGSSHASHIQSYIQSCVRNALTLQKIDFSNSQISDQDLLSLPEVRSVTEIKLSQCKITGLGLNGDFFKNATKLVLECCSKIKDQFIKDCSSTMLQELNLQSTNVDGSFLKGEAYKHLEILNLHHCKSLKESSFKEYTGKLLKIDLSQTGITGACLKEKSFETIVEANFHNCKKLKEREVPKWACKSIQIINLSHTNFTGICLQGKVLNQLTTLIMKDCKKVADSTIANCSSKLLTIIDLSGTKIKGYCFYSDTFERLNSLIIRNCEEITLENKKHVKEKLGSSHVHM